MSTTRRVRPKLGRILSIDPRSKAIAWTLFRDSKIIDQDIKTSRKAPLANRVNQVAVPYLVELLDEIQPHALLVPESEPQGSRRRGARTARCIAEVVSEAHGRGIAVYILNSQTVKSAFNGFDGDAARNKRDVYERIIEQYPEMQLMLPRARAKMWDGEEYFEPLFNTVAMFLAWRMQPSPMDRRRGIA